MPRCPLDEFACSSGACLPLSLRCDGYADCADGSDEACGCAGAEGAYCQGPGHFLCADNVCVRAGGQDEFASVQCDGVWQCKDGSDEIGCDGYAGEGRKDIVVPYK